MALGSKYQIDMCHGPLFGKVLLFSVPLMVSNIMQVLFNAVDLVIIGRFASSNSLAAVGACGSLTALFLNFFFGLSAGANVVVARCIGARQKKATSHAVHTAMAVAFWGGIVLAAAGVFIARTALEIMETPAAVLPKAVLYMRLFALSVPLILLYNYGSAVMRATGDTRRPLVFMLIAGVIKVLLTFVLVRFGGMDVAGLVLASIIANSVAVFLIFRALSGARDASRLLVRKIGFTRGSLRDILKIGFPAGIQGSLFGLSNVVIQSAINSFGPAAMAGSAAAGSLEGIVYVGFNAYYYSTISFVGQNYGAGKYKRLLRSFFYTLTLAVATAAVLGWSIYLVGEPLLRCYNPEREVIGWGLLRMRYLILPYLLCAAMEVLSGGLRGLGHSFKPMIVTLLGVCVFRVAWVWWILPLDRTMNTLLLSYTVSWILVLTVNGGIFYFVVHRLFRQKAHAAPGSSPRHLTLRP